MYANRSQIVVGSKALEVTREPVVSNSTELILYKFMTNITPIFRQKPVGARPNEWGYRFNVMTVIRIQIKSGKKNLDFDIELQEVTNQPGWSTGTIGGLQQAIADINSSSVVENYVDDTDVSFSGTVFNLSTTPDFIFGVFVNGIKQLLNADYTVSSNQINFSYTLVNDSISVIYLYN